MWSFFHRLASPKHFYLFANRLIPWLGWGTLITFIIGTYLGLVVAPTDYQQGESYRIIYIHVPAAWMSMFVYMVMAIAGGIGLVWKMKMADIIASSAAPLGAAFTILALITGSLWGKPMWGTWWIWDARLTSELILLFLYLGFIALQSAIEDRRTAANACAILALVGVVNIPIIHYSVEWWNTLHQGATVTRFGKAAMATSMLIPLLTMFLAFKLYFATTLLMRARVEILERERNTTWMKNMITGSDK
ncbi:Cytochrome c-type biogenesis protein CcmC, putative heme lyase for CcmE [hydrothermal vent metagenome]|uniref:Cytochrome c-type biogenesis protein CcmC, putative heme lyase for CcmE n=1 Tax=hydrothermal vent metagenome TaxID=652676 RepID=A0A3B1B5N5_9ZZZZ